MQSLAASADAAAYEAAERLTGENIERFDVLPRWGNNRIYRVETATSNYALKAYGCGSGSAHRLHHEYKALAFLSGNGAAQYVPRSLGIDHEAGCALYEWIGGGPLRTHNLGDVDAAVDFIGRAFAARIAPAASALSAAAEALTSGTELFANLRARLVRLRNATADDADAGAFVVDELVPRFALLTDACRRAASAADISVERPIDGVLLTLSPSDFSFHNALRRADGSLVFIDFEYFGWDDPVKLVADFLWHPGMHISAEEAARFAHGAETVFGVADPTYANRLRAYFPLFGLKWCLIILNEFLADDWNRRQFSGQPRSWDDVKAAQLRKARLLLQEVTEGTREAVLW